MKNNNNNSNIDLFLIGWIVGITDGEGNFSVEISKVYDMKLGEKVQLNYNVAQHWANESI
jgi:hypothetical protein